MENIKFYFENLQKDFPKKSLDFLKSISDENKKSKISLKINFINKYNSLILEALNQQQIQKNILSKIISINLQNLKQLNSIISTYKKNDFFDFIETKITEINQLKKIGSENQNKNSEKNVKRI